MNKTILALAIATVSTGAVATVSESDFSRNEYASWNEFYTAVQESDNVDAKKQMAQVWAESHNLVLWFEEEGEDTVVKLIRPDGEQVEINIEAIKSGKAGQKDILQLEVLKQQLKSSNRHVIVEPIEGVDPITPIPVTREDAIEHLKKGSDVLNNEIALQAAVKHRINNDNAYEFSGNEKLEAINRITGANFEVHYDLDGNSFLVNETTGQKFTPEQVKEMAIASRKQIQEEAEKREAGVTPIAPVEPLPEVGHGELGEYADGVVQKQAQAAKDEAYSSMAELYSAQALSIDKNAEDIATLFSEVDRLDEKMDGVMAGVHAVNNARPYLSAEGDTAIGAGVGYAGESGAVAFGLAHAFTDGLSASMTLNVTTGSYSEVSGGAGVQYKF